jgi:hypothetical protein
MHRSGARIAPRRRTRAALLAAILGGLFVGAGAGCQAPGPDPAVPSAGGKVGDLSSLGTGPTVGNPDEFLMVDCLLPARVKRLGRQLTYLGARQPTRTSGIDCEIRGGEYVAYDRADYRTALAVWMEAAKEGDPKAETYVGEIYEKGLGGTPDYAAAAEWYQRAANRGYGPAQINLGQLYEQGLGVSKDEVLALNWYRRASGFDVAGLTYVVSTDVAGELESLREQAATHAGEADQLRREIGELQTRLGRVQTGRAVAPAGAAPSQERAALERDRADLERARAELAAERAALQDRQQQTAGRLAADSAAERSELARLRQELTTERAALDRARQQMAEQTATATAAQRAELGRTRQEIETDRQALARERARAADAAQELERERASLTAERRQLTADQQELETRRAQAATEKAAAEVELLLEGLRTRQLELTRHGDGLAAREAQQAASEAEFAARESALAERETTLADREAAVLARETRVEAQSATVAARDTLIKDQAAQVAAREARIAGLETEIAAREARLGEEEATVAARAARIEQLETDVAARAARLGEQEAALREQASAVLEQQARLENRQAEIAANAAQLDSRGPLDQQIAELNEAIEERRQQLEQLNRQANIALVGPTITMLEPTLPLTQSVPVVRTRAGLDGRPLVGRVEAPAGLLSLVINERPQDFNDQYVFRTMIPVPQTGVEVAIKAIDNRGKQASLSFVLSPEDAPSTPSDVTTTAGPVGGLARIPPIDFGRYHALVIGNNHYSHLPALATAVADAEGVADLLANKYGFEVTLLRDANRYQILSALNEYRANLTAEDNLLIYYAGHGELDQLNQRGHWLPVDAELDSTANWISNADITDILNAVAAKHVLVVADSCYSGSLTRASLARLSSGMTEREWVARLRALGGRRSRTALTSGGLQPTLDSGGGRNSVFAKAFLAVLTDNDGLLEGQRVHEEVQARVTYAAEQVRFEQVPEYAPIRFAGHEGGEFFFVPRV